MIIPLASHIEQMVEVASRPSGGHRERPERVGLPATGQVLEDRELPADAVCGGSSYRVASGRPS
ncbi:hypothetical protein ABZ783_30165 [Micromonospora sp. NPDC047738]|uniref:hypothetical protein n=1 Tax=Micromonospora sp. NPDC047738 TaxID=3155741 RepID=UPI0033F4DF59